MRRCQIPYQHIYGWEFTTIAALVAPRPLLFVNSHDDVGFPMAANRRIMLRLRRLYAMYDKPDLLDEFVSQGPAGEHEYRPDSRVAIFRWIQEHNGRNPQTVRDADFERFPEAATAGLYAGQGDFHLRCDQPPKPMRPSYGRQKETA